MTPLKIGLDTFDWLIDAVLDLKAWAQETLSRRKPDSASPQIPSGLRPEDVLFIETPIRAVDLFEARSAFALIAHRLIPLDLEDAVVAYASAGDQTWHVAVTRKASLRLARDTGRSQVGVHVCDPAGRRFVFRDQPERQALRRLALSWGGAVALAAIALLTLPASATHWAERSLQSLRDQRVEIASEIRVLQSQAEARSGQDRQAGLEVNRLVEMFNRVNESLGPDVQVRHAQIVGQRYTVQLVAPARSHFDETISRLSEARGLTLIEQRFLGLQNQDAILELTLEAGAEA